MKGNTIVNQVLLVNDNNEICNRTATMLVDMGWDVFVAEKEELVFESTVARRPMMLIADIEMEAGVGFESIATARSLFPSLFIVAVTRGADKDIWPRVSEVCGANSYVAGPVSASKLQEAIEAGIEKGLVSMEPPSDSGIHRAL